MTCHNGCVVRGPHLEIVGVRTIVLLQALHLGDFLCSVPALRALKNRFPTAEVTLVGLPWVRSILDRYRYVDRFVEFPGYWGLEGVPWEPDRTERFIREARAYGYDLAIQMHGDGRLSNGFVAKLGARATLGYGPLGVERRRQLDVELDMVERDHETVRWLRLVGILGATGSPDLEFPILPVDRLEADRVVAESGIDSRKPMVAIHPGARDPAKRWPAERFSRAADWLAWELGAEVVITGSRHELELANQVARGMSRQAHVVAGQTSIGGLAALLSRIQLLVTNDTGPSHLAAALAVPSVVLFGPTDPARWAPLDGELHSALWAGPGNPVSSISVDQVVEGALTVVKQCASLTF